MLELKNTTWATYNHAYGDASDIPALLFTLSEYPKQTDNEAEPYFSLWSALCHQGDTYTAAYAAVPHIVSLAAGAPSRITPDFLLLPVSIEIARSKGRGPEIPSELKKEYHSAISTMPSIVGQLDNSEADELWSLSCTSAVAVAGGQIELAEAILELEGDVVQEFLEWSANR